MTDTNITAARDAAIALYDLRAMSAEAAEGRAAAEAREQATNG